MSSLIATTRRAPALLPLRATAVPSLDTTQRRSHQTTARTKRALRIRPHPSHLLRDTSSPTDEITFNPPSSQPTPFHTPFKFLPPTDPRRSNNLHLLFPASAPIAYLPPETKPSRDKSYHLTKEDVEEMRRLRWEEPETWTMKKLAAKYKCSTKFVKIAARVTDEYKKKLEEGKRRRMATWGPRKMKAYREKGQRIEMLFRGEL